MAVVFEMEYNAPTVRHAYVYCPECGKKFNAREIGSGRSFMTTEAEFLFARYECPCCGVMFEARDCVIKKVPYPKCAEGALQKKEVWE